MEISLSQIFWKGITKINKTTKTISKVQFWWEFPSWKQEEFLNNSVLGGFISWFLRANFSVPKKISKEYWIKQIPKFIKFEFFEVSFKVVL